MKIAILDHEDNVIHSPVLNKNLEADLLGLVSQSWRHRHHRRWLKKELDRVVGDLRNETRF